ncbi:MAG: selenide, water dikinase SelD, partial [Clostridia bacterium]|nr:selenide, water dikinase SelD [Clostridia bacterium]
MVQYDVHACTDVTGFGLMGHMFEMMEGSGTQAVVDTGALDLIPEARELARFGLIPAGAYRNRTFAEKAVDLENIELSVQDMLFDPQTSGGLLIACAAKDADRMFEALKKTVPSAQRIGTVQTYEGGKRIFLR